LDPSDEDFWRFSWHEIGTEDVAAFIDYILDTTKQRALHFLGHSQGCTTLVVLLSMRPEYNKLVKTAVLLAPAVFMRHTSTLLQTVFRSFIMAMPDKEFMYHNGVLNKLLSNVCGLFVARVFCTTFFLISNGKISKHLNTVSAQRQYIILYISLFKISLFSERYSSDCRHASCGSFFSPAQALHPAHGQRQVQTIRFRDPEELDQLQEPHTSRLPAT